MTHWCEGATILGYTCAMHVVLRKWPVESSNTKSRLPLFGYPSTESIWGHTSKNGFKCLLRTAITSEEASPSRILHTINSDDDERQPERWGHRGSMAKRRKRSSELTLRKIPQNRRLLDHFLNLLLHW